MTITPETVSLAEHRFIKNSDVRSVDLHCVHQLFDADDAVHSK